MGLVIFLVVGAVIAVVVAQQLALAGAKKAYERALEVLGGDPDDNNNRISALNLGRKYARLARRAAGSKGVALFDEVALQNDLNARLGRARPAAAAPRSVVESEDRITRLTKLAALRESGVLSADEFEREKQRLLAS